MESPLSFNATENFRKKLLLRNLKPYKVDDSFVADQNVNTREFQIVDYSVVDSPNVEDIGNIQEASLYPLNKYGPTNTNSTYGNTVQINLNLNTQSNFGKYGYSDSIGSKLELIGDNQENLLYVKNLYGPVSLTPSYGDTVDINQTYGINTNLGIYGYPKTINSKLEQIGNVQEIALIVKNIYKPQLASGDYGTTKWSINNDLIVLTNGSGLYGPSTAINSRLNQIGNEQEILLKVKNVFKNNGNDFGLPVFWINNDQIILNPSGDGLYTIDDTIDNYLEQFGNQQEIFLRVKNKYNPEISNDFGSTRYDINDDSQVLGTNQGEYDYSDSIGSKLQIDATNYRGLLFPINQYGPEGPQSATEVNPNVNLNTNSNEGNYTPTDAIGSNLELIGDQQEVALRVKNKYNPNIGVDFGPTKYSVNDDSPVLGSNQGEYGASSSINSSLENIAVIEENDVYVINRYVPGDGTYGNPELVTIEDLQIQTTGQRYYNSAQSFIFLPSEYSPVSLLLSDDPQGSDGLLSQDSTLARIAAQRLQKEFKYRVAAELLSETIGRVNVLDSSIDPDSGEISVKPRLDPFNAVGIISGNVPLLDRNYRVTAPDLIIGKALNFASKLAGLYSPYSIIPDEYFDYPKKRLLNQVLENPVALVAGTVMGAIRSITSANIRRGSDLFLAYTTPATRDLLWGQLFYNEYRPDYRLNSLRNPNLFSPKPNFYIGKRRQTIEDIVNPVKDMPEFKDNKPLNVAVYGYSDVATEYEGEKVSRILFGPNSRNFYGDNVSITSNFSWSTKKNIFKPGKLAGQGGAQTFEQSSVFDANITKQFQESQSTNYKFTEGSILDVTQKIIDAGSRNGVRKLEHVGNVINQVSKVFNDGYSEITKGSRVIRYVTKNSEATSPNISKGATFEGLEYCRIFTKDVPYYTYQQLQKSQGGIRNIKGRQSYSVFDNTYNLNIAPMNDKNGQSTNIVDGRVKKYMFSLENLAWRTSNKPGFTVDDLPACEKGPNGGRIMWFPPYDLSFDDTTRADFQSVDFIGRPESIYTYKNSQRTGTLSWTILVDHPSISNLLIEQELKNVTPESQVTKIMDSFFAGCTTYDVYELAKRYLQFSPNDIQEAINFVKNREDYNKVIKDLAPSETSGVKESQDTLDGLSDIDKEYFFYFDDDKPEDTDPINGYDTTYNDYVSRQGYYSSNARDKITLYDRNLNKNIPNVTAILDNGVGNFSYKEYIDSRTTSIDQFFTDQVIPSKDRLDDFITKIGKILDSGGKVKFHIYTTASSTASSSYNKELSERRIESIKEYILKSKTTAGKTLSDFVSNDSLKIKENPLGDSEKNLKTNGLDDIDCSLKFTDAQKNVESIYSVQAMACRRARISKIEVDPAKKSKNSEEQKPEGAPQNINGATGENVQNRPQQGSSAPIQETQVYKGLTKKLLRGLLSECSYFEMIQESNPFVYDGIKKKFKNFNPAFHSITPEGLNSRLTFLQQCMRPGDTIPTVKQTNGVNSLSTEQDASNTAFGAPPVLVLRVGDFFNTKIIPDNLSIKFDKGALFDINPEGVGIQPMIATISLTFKFIGGQSLSGPISKLQNALSFNYYANTELYDERSETTDDSFDKIDLEVLKLLNEVPAPKPDEDINNKIGTTIGKVESSTDQPDGTKSGKISYQKNMADIPEPVKNYATKTYTALKDISLKYSLGGLYIANTDRKYQEGLVYNVNTKIYGKIENSQKKIDELFDNFKDDINNDTTPLLADIDEPIFNFKTTEKNKIRKQIKKLAEERKSVYIQDFDNYNNTISTEELKLINLIDKMNFVSGSRDGFIEKGEAIIFQTSGTSEVTPTGDGNSYADTLAELQGDLSIIGNNMNEFIQKLEETKIITNTDEEKWKESFQFDLKINTQIDVYNNRLNMVFGKDIADDTENFINNIVSVLDDEDKDKWKTFLARNIQWDLNTKTPSSYTGITNQYINQKSVVSDRFKNFNDNYLTQKFNTYNPYNKDKKRVFDFSTQIPTNTTDAENLKKLNSTVNSEDNKFNLKFSFK